MATWLFIAFMLIGCLSCVNEKELARSSFGDDKNAKASSASVISMGRDDDDGKAMKWHIGGGTD